LFFLFAVLCFSTFFSHLLSIILLLFFFFNDTATTEIYTLSLHDALPISREPGADRRTAAPVPPGAGARRGRPTPSRTACTGSRRDRKSTRLNSSHVAISYAVFCLKKKKKKK